MIDTEALAALLDDLFPAVQRDGWPFTSEQAAARLIAAGVTLTPADAPSDLPTITELAGALYQTDPPESWMRTGTDEYRKRAEAMLTFIAEDRAALSGDRPSPEADPPMVECAICGDYSVKGVEVHEACLEMLSRGGADPATAEVLNLSSSSQPDAEGLDVERLARAMNKVRPYGGNPSEWAKVAARAIAAEYARLAPDSAQEAE